MSIRDIRLSHLPEKLKSKINDLKIETEFVKTQLIAFKVKILGLNEAQPNEGVHCLDGLQQSDIENSFYITSDESEKSSILNASKSPNSIEECKFSGNINDGFILKFNSEQWY